MMIRIMLVGFVASLGLDLPSDQDVARWAQSGRNWANARMTNLSNLRFEAAGTLPDSSVVPETSDEPVTASTVAAESTKITTDTAFEAVSNAIVEERKADLLASRSLDSDIEPKPSVQVTALDNVGLPSGEEAATVAAPPLEVEAVVVAITAPSSPTVGAEPSVTSEEEEVEETPSRLDKLNAAVKLTREAAQAWSSLLQETAEDVGLTR